MLKAGTMHPLWMHSRVVISFMLIVCCFLSKAALGEERIVFSGHPDWPPFSWRSGDTIIGLGPEILRMALKEQPVELEGKTHETWKRVMHEGERGSIDIIAGCFLTAERTEFLTYTAEPFMDDQNVIWVKKEKAFPFQQWSDLIGKRGVAARGDSYGEEFDSYIQQNLEMWRVSTNKEVLKLLAHDRADYYPFSLYGGIIQVKKYGYEGKIIHLKKPFTTEGAYLAFARTSPMVKYLPHIERAIAQYKRDGTIERLTVHFIELYQSETAEQ